MGPSTQVPVFSRARIRNRYPDRSSGWWALPIYVWSVGGVGLVQYLYFDSAGLVSPTTADLWVNFFELIASLLFVVLFQDAAVLILGGPVATLGITGKEHTATTFAVIDIVFLGFSYFGIVAWAYASSIN